ncbi:MAG: hypothetical protein WBG04_20155, partial [Haloferula sp.]
SFDYTVTASDLTRSGNIGILLYSFGTGGASTAANQSFFDNVRLDLTVPDDTDEDDLPDGYENSFIGISPAGDFNVTGLASLSGLAGADFDGDGLSDLAEYLGPDGNPNSGDESRPDKVDTDDDGLNDPVEVSGSANIWTGTSAGSTPGDITSPTDPDSDNDGILDGEEVIPGTDGFITNPALADSDGDGYSDSDEVLALTDPGLNTSYPATPLVFDGTAVKNFPTTFASGALRRFTNSDKGKTFRLTATANPSAFPAGLGADGWIGVVLNPNTASATAVGSADDNGMGFLARSPNIQNPQQVFDTSAAASTNIQGTGGFTETQNAGTGDVSFDFSFTLSPDYDTNGEVSFTLTLTDDGPNSPYSTSGTFLSNNGTGGNLDLYLESFPGTVGAGNFAATLSEVLGGGNLMINSVAFDGTNFTINFTGEPNTTYDIASDPDLSSGFSTIETTATTDGMGNGAITFPVVVNRFFRVQTQ